MLGLSTARGAQPCQPPSECRHPRPTGGTHSKLRLRWPAQYGYGVIRTVVHFDLPVTNRADQTEVSQRTIARYADRFDAVLGITHEPIQYHANAQATSGCCRPWVT